MPNMLLSFTPENLCSMSSRGIADREGRRACCIHASLEGVVNKQAVMEE